MKIVLTCFAASAAIAGLAACSSHTATAPSPIASHSSAAAGASTPYTPAPSTASGPQSLTGAWTTADGLPITFTDDGACAGAFYSDGRPLDIGGPSTCQLSSTPDSTGRYKLRVIQGGNRATYSVEFQSAEKASVYDSSGQLAYSITRF